jgi:sulfofructose kinase
VSPAAPLLDVLCVGFACVDLTIPFSGLPRYDRKTECPELLLEGGGPASTAAVALGRLGLRVGLLSTLGDDGWGRFARERLRAEGVPDEGVLEAEGCRTPLSVILADPAGGARTILWNGGTLPPLDEAQVRRAWRPARLVLVDEQYPEAASAALELARRDGAVVLFDAGTARGGLDALVEGADCLVGAQHFASGLTGVEDEREALAALQRRNGRPVVATRGAEGCWLHDGRGIREFPGVCVPALDSTAAGDAFHAAVAFGLLQGWPLERCLPFANHYAAHNCVALGGRAGLLGLDEVKEWQQPES